MTNLSAVITTTGQFIAEGGGLPRRRYAGRLRVNLMRKLAA